MKKKRKYIYLEKCLIIRILQIYIFSFYDFLFFISLSFIETIKDMGLYLLAHAIPRISHGEFYLITYDLVS